MSCQLRRLPLSRTPAVDVAHYQIEKRNACGVCCQKVSEAEAFARGDLKDILVSNQVRDPVKIDRLARIPTFGARTICCIDDIDNVTDLSAAAVRHGTQIEVLVWKHGGLPYIFGRSDVEYIKCSDEHGVISDPDGILKINEKLKLVPGHCDPTCKVHDWYVGVRNGKVESLWPVSARGRAY